MSSGFLLLVRDTEAPLGSYVWNMSSGFLLLVRDTLAQIKVLMKHIRSSVGTQTEAKAEKIHSPSYS